MAVYTTIAIVWTSNLIAFSLNLIRL